jgi:hypothetical protein
MRSGSRRVGKNLKDELKLTVGIGRDLSVLLEW